MEGIVEDDEIRSGQPRIDGTRITVLDVKRRVIDGGEDPHVVAGEYDISLVDLFAALTVYYQNRERFAEDERSYAADRVAGERRAEELVTNDADLSEQAD